MQTTGPIVLICKPPPMEGTVTHLGELANSPHTDETGTYALAINNEETPVIVGQSKGLAFRYKNGKMERAGILLTLNEAGVAVDAGKSIAYAINENGWIVGIVYARPGKPEPVAFLDRDGETIDLNTLPDVSAAGWKLTEALGINNLEQIAGIGINPQGQVPAFLLNPKTTPGIAN